MLRMCMGRVGEQCGFVNFKVRTSCKQCGAMRLAVEEGSKKRATGWRAWIIARLTRYWTKQKSQRLRGMVG